MLHVTLLSSTDNGVRQQFTDVLSRLKKDTTSIPHLESTYSLTEQAVTLAREYLASQDFDECVDVIGFGSMGRFEMSEESDLDYLVVCHNDAHEPHEEVAEKADGLRSVVIPGKELREPGSTGMFGVSVKDVDLYEVVGLEDDTNSGHSRRVLLLEESVSLFRPELHAELLRKMVARYVETIPLVNSKVPRFLVNDLARYWRQLTVDYQAKSESNSQSALRRLKLLVPRKFTYASSVLPLLTLELRDIEQESVVDRVVETFQKPPTLRFLEEIEYLESMYPEANIARDGLAAVDAVERFNGLLGNSSWREQINGISSREEAASVPEFKEARQIARDLEVALDTIFFSSPLETLTRKHLVF